jgi:hypothetical protein
MFMSSPLHSIQFVQVVGVDRCGVVEEGIVEGEQVEAVEQRARAGGGGAAVAAHRWLYRS